MTATGHFGPSGFLQRFVSRPQVEGGHEVSNRFLQRLRDGEAVLGLALTYPAPGIIEGMCKGWDWVWIDMQHGEIDYETMCHAVRTASSIGVDSIVRPDSQDYGLLGKYADAGPSGMLVPMIDTPEAAQAVVRALRFPPLGGRSFGSRRLADLYGSDYLRGVEQLVIVMIETDLALQNVERIIATEGIDAVLLGPGDFSIQRGIPLGTPAAESSELQEAMQKIARAAREAGKICGALAWDPEALESALDMGYQIIGCGTEAAFMRTGAPKKLEELRAVLAKRAGTG